MIQSMTGFGKAVRQLDDKKITIEIKTLNSKNLDLNTRLPSAYREQEMQLRKYAAQQLKRGKVDLNIYVENTSGRNDTSINTALLQEYMRQLQAATTETVATDVLLPVAMRMPDVMINERLDIPKEEWQAVHDLHAEAVASVIHFRQDEGKVLADDFKLRIEKISQLLDEVTAIDKDRTTAVRERLRSALDELKERVDENRYEQELIYYLEKYDITEEVIRLKNHLKYFIENLESASSNGKKLGFISQEMGREINTIGSKSNHAPMQKLVVQMKDELEKIKEQLLNVL